MLQCTSRSAILSGAGLESVAWQVLRVNPESRPSSSKADSRALAIHSLASEEILYPFCTGCFRGDAFAWSEPGQSGWRRCVVEWVLL